MASNDDSGDGGDDSDDSADATPAKPPEGPRECPECTDRSDGVVVVEPIAVPIGVHRADVDPGWALRCPQCPHVFERYAEERFGSVEADDERRGNGGPDGDGGDGGDDFPGHHAP